MMPLRPLLFLLPALFCCANTVHAQRAGRLRGAVLDKDTRSPLEGVTVAVPSAGSGIGAVTDSAGFFAIDSVPVGKHTVTAVYTGYATAAIPEVLLVTGKETVLPILLEESAQRIGEVTVRTQRLNEMAVISARPFDVQETERYAGSRADPARAASNFAGVQGADDSRNDIIVRGNSPQGILWRLEGVDIPSPSHFAIPGTSGGPVSLLNTKTLQNSEFFTGAFPAEYGASTAGVFDLRLRAGNSERYEVTAQLGFLGTELAAEGPLNPGRKAKAEATSSATRQKPRGGERASFLVAYRYSTLALFQGLKIPIGTSSVPQYQDATVKLNFPLSRRSNLSFFGIGGLSRIDLIVSTLTEPSEEIYGESDRDQYFKSNTGVAGTTFTSTLNSKTFVQVSAAVTGNQITAHHDKVYRGPGYSLDSMRPILDYDFITRSVVGHGSVTRKFSPQHTLKAGLLGTRWSMDYADSSRQYPIGRQDWVRRLDFAGSTALLQAYAQHRYRPSDQWTLTAGLHLQYLTHNGSTALEPRLGARFRPGSGVNAFSLGYGLHSQMQPLYWYFSAAPQAPPMPRRPPESRDVAGFNYHTGFTRSHHLVGGWDRSFRKTFRIRTEAYYQYLFNVPTERRAGSSFSGINGGSSFSRLFPDTLVNRGTGYNYGGELTLERPFARGWYALLTASVFDSKARGADGIYRPTDYASTYALNLLGGTEQRLSKATTLILGGKITAAGGRRYSPPDVAASNAFGDLIVVDSLRNTLRFPPYFRADVKAGVRINAARITHELAVDLVNVAGVKNILALTYSPERAAAGDDPFVKEYQLGFLPLFYYRVDFGFRAGTPSSAAHSGE